VLDPETILQQVETIKSWGFPTTEYDVLRVRSRLHFGLLRRRLRTLKNKVGTKHKALASLESLLAVLKACAPGNAQDQKMKQWWTALIMTGQRPRNLADAALTLGPEGVTLQRADGTKTSARNQRRGLMYRYAWSFKPNFSFDVSLPTISKAGQEAAAVNRWLKKKNFTTFTSTMPRVRLDHVLRCILAEGLIIESEYVRLMDHTVETSNQSYFSFA